MKPSSKSLGKKRAIDANQPTLFSFLSKATSDTRAVKKPKHVHSSCDDAGFFDVSTVQTTFGPSSSKVTLDMGSKSNFERDTSANGVHEPTESKSPIQETGPSGDEMKGTGSIATTSAKKRRTRGQSTTEPRKKKLPHTQATRDRSNKKRAAARQDPDGVYQKKMAEQFAARLAESSETDAAVLVNIVRRKVAHQSSIRKILSRMTLNPMEIVTSVVAAARSADRVASLAHDNAVWTHLQPVIPFLVDCARNPFSFNLDHAVSNGFLTQQKRALSTKRAEYYVRIIPFSCVHEIRDAVASYIKAQVARWVRRGLRSPLLLLPPSISFIIILFLVFIIVVITAQ